MGKCLLHSKCSNWPLAFTQSQRLPKGNTQASTQPFGASIIKKELGGGSKNCCVGSNLGIDPLYMSPVLFSLDERGALLFPCFDDENEAGRGACPSSQPRAGERQAGTLCAALCCSSVPRPVSAGATASPSPTSQWPTPQNPVIFNSAKKRKARPKELSQDHRGRLNWAWTRAQGGPVYSLRPRLLAQTSFSWPMNFY